MTSFEGWKIVAQSLISDHSSSSSFWIQPMAFRLGFGRWGGSIRPTGDIAKCKILFMTVRKYMLVSPHCPHVLTTVHPRKQMFPNRSLMYRSPRKCTPNVSTLPEYNPPRASSQYQHFVFHAEVPYQVFPQSNDKHRHKGESTPECNN